MKKIIKICLFILLFSLIPIFYIVIYAEEESDIDWSIFSSEYNEVDFESFLKEQPLSIYDDKPSLTFITPGIGCDALSWGYDDVSLNNIFECLNNRNAQIFKLYKYKTKEVEGVAFENFISRYELLSTATSDYTKPFVFVCDLDKKISHHKIDDYSNISSVAYNELENLINYTIFEYVKMKISLGVNEEDLRIPRINLIGHSRGGILNMIYSLDYQNIVDSLYSVGTPYNGSTLYDELLSNGADLCNFKVDDLISFEDDAIRDCVDPDVYEDLKLNWNIYQQNSSSFHTKLYAIGCSMSIDLIDDIIDNVSNNGFIKILIKCFSFFSIDRYTNLKRDEYNDILDISSRYSSGELVDKFSGFESLGDFAQFTANIFNYLTDDDILSELCSEDYISAIGYTITYLLQSMVFDYELDQYVMQNDFFVDLESQQAEGYLNVIQYEKIFTVGNCDTNLLTNDSWEIAIGHNLETKDEDIINCILSNIYLGENDTGINIKNNIVRNYHEFIGYNEDIAIKNGILTLTNYIDGLNNYILSDKFFSKDYTIARVPTSIIYEQKPILELKFNTNILMSEKALAYLKGNVKFTVSGSLSNLYNVPFSVSNNMIYRLGTLYKYSNDGSTTNVRLISINEISDGAFYGQNIQYVNIEGYNTISIGNHAFCDCVRLNKIFVSHDIVNIGDCAFKNTLIYNKHENVIVRNALIHSNGGDGITIRNSSDITYVAPGAFKSNSSQSYLVLEKENVVIADNAFIDTTINNIILYTNKVNLDENNFFYSNKSRHPMFYSYYTFNNDYINYTLSDSFELLLFDGINTRRIYYQLTSSYQDPNVEYDHSDISLFRKDILGYVRNYEQQNDDVLEVINSLNLFIDTDNLVWFYRVCSDESYHEFDNIIDIDEETHFISCCNCDYRAYVEHNFDYIESSSHHEKVCPCGRTFIEQHTYGDECIYSNHVSHTISCIDCGHVINDPHNFENRYVEHDNQLYNANVCVDCGYIIPLYSVTAVDNDDNHLLSDGTYLEHEYIDIQYQGITIEVCKYCGHHIHNGIILQIAGNNTNHSVYCYYCQTVINMTHNFDNYICQYNDLYDGYHTKECTGCGYIVEEEHHYIYDDTFNDLHHLICMECGAVTIYHHDEVLNCNPTARYHTEYCDICECYYYVLHNFEYYDIIGSDDDGHYMICNDCSYYKKVNHTFDRYYNEYGHYDKCTICGYETELSTHTPQFNCSSLDPHDHYLYCTECSYRLSTTLVYQTYHEYEHWCTCSICNTRIHEPHEENCECIDNILHMYMCNLCDVEYEMPHFVNNHLIIYENYEPGYDLWVCTYCGYMEIVSKGGNS